MAEKEGMINRKALAALIIVVIVIMAPLAVMYILDDGRSRGEVVFTISKEDMVGQDIELTMEDLLAMDRVEGESSYQNFFTNWRAEGTYEGVKVSDLLEMLGGMSEGQNITVSANDGYNQTYCWRNVYNDWDDQTVQGDMVLAYGFNGTRVPEWEDGPMIVFIPDDGAYSNDDCLNTSCPDQGCNVYLSAGSRWVRNAESLVLRVNSTQGTSFTFAVMGDSQGNTPLLEVVVEAMNERQPDFVLHLGDTAPKALDGYLDMFVDAIDELDSPMRITPGNHDIMINDTIFYEYFDTGDYYFDVGDVRFISLDSATQDVTDDQFAWLDGILNDSAGMRKIVFSHVPSYDPRGGEDEPHTLDDIQDCLRFQSMMDEQDVDIVLNGHIHIYHEEMVNDTQYIISGGAGAALYAPPDEGGFHHFLMFNVTDDSITWEVVEVEAEELQSEYVIVSGSEGSVNISLNELMTLSSYEGYSEYQNVYGNWRAGGNYTGVLISDLVDMVGGMGVNDTLRVTSVDGYYQDFCYWNVYPDSTWFDAQGNFLLGYMCEGDTPPDWDDGFRIVFMTDDGNYSNQDCLDTSCEGQGGHIYLSAGARWVKWVTSIEIISGS